MKTAEKSTQSLAHIDFEIERKVANWKLFYQLFILCVGGEGVEEQARYPVLTFSYTFFYAVIDWTKPAFYQRTRVKARNVDVYAVLANCTHE